MRKFKMPHILTILNLLTLSIFAFLTIYPFINMVAVSLREPSRARNEVYFIPKEFNLDVYYLIARDPRIFNAYRNTIVYADWHIRRVVVHHPRRLRASKKNVVPSPV